MLPEPQIFGFFSGLLGVLGRGGGGGGSTDLRVGRSDGLVGLFLSLMSYAASMGERKLIDTNKAIAASPASRHA